MNLFQWPYLVVLAPAIASAIAGLVINLMPLVVSRYACAKAYIRVFLCSKEHVETTKSFVENASFIGPGVGVFFGISTESNYAYVLAGVALVAGIRLALALNRLLRDIESLDAQVSHRKMAGLVRSIVKSELEKVQNNGVRNGSSSKRP